MNPNPSGPLAPDLKRAVRLWTALWESLQLHEVERLNPLVQARLREILAQKKLDTSAKTALLMDLIGELPRYYRQVHRLYDEIELLRINKDVNVYIK